MEEINCGCEDENRYVCWAYRYNLGICSSSEVEESGGPCGCICHYEDCESDES